MKITSVIFGVLLTIIGVGLAAIMVVALQSAKEDYDKAAPAIEMMSQLAEGASNATASADLSPEAKAAKEKALEEMEEAKSALDMIVPALALNAVLALLGLAIIVFYFVKKWVTPLALILIVLAIITIFIDPNIDNGENGKASPRTIGMVLAAILTVGAALLVLADKLRSKQASAVQ